MRFLLAVCTLFTLNMARADDPDAAYESQLHDIYIRFNSEKINESEWRQLVGGRANEAYQIHEGDNLWNVSRVLFGDGNYWPKVWSANASVVNPHLIETGNSIRFILGDVADAPAFTITENSDVAEDKASDDVNEDVEIPPPSQEYKPVLRRLPPSLRDFTQGSAKYTAGVSLEKLERPKFDDSTILTSRILETYPKPVAQVVEVEEAEMVASDSQHVVVAAAPGQLQPGQKYLVVHSRGKLPEDKTLERVGLETVVEYQGLVEIKEPLVGLKKNSDKVLFRAVVVKGILPVTADADLVPPPFIYYDSQFEGPRSSLVAQVVGGDGERDTHLFAQNMIVYINRGTNDGVVLGQILPVRSVPKVHKVSTVVAEATAPSAYIKIVDAQPRFSTAYVLWQRDDVRPGDLTGEGAMHPDPRPNKLSQRD
jgi:hypothetical protein